MHYRLCTRLSRAFDRFRGAPIEWDLARYEKALDEAAWGSPGAAGRVSAAGAGAGSRDGSDAAAVLAAAEAAERALGLKPYREQLVAALAMCSGKVVQMDTGEGKTLAAALAACWIAPRDGGVHVLTANDYLAGRDAAWMGPLYRAMGLSVASIAAADGPEDRRAAYRADVVYLTARELGFDYLRDGLARAACDKVQRALRSAIIDEADFILIDEARVPLVIAGLDAQVGAGPGPSGGPEASSGSGGGARGHGLADPAEEAEALAADAFARGLAPGADFQVDPEGRKVSLTLAGLAAVEADGSVGLARVHAALHARWLLSRDVDYIVSGAYIEMVDAFTGRVAERRKWPWGVQEAVEAKEGLPIGPAGRVYGTITVRDLVGLYPKLAAMTATAESAAGEFEEAYGLGTVVVPPIAPSRRIDEPDLVFASKEEKAEAVAAAIIEAREAGRPVLVGTASVRDSDRLSALLSARGVPHALLNARDDGREAELIAAAGRLGAVTISTNMAGRGTDIRLDPDPSVAAAGGLLVIGTERHESRRVDDQLRGRAARQGDPGSSRFILSLEDGLFERYGVKDYLPGLVGGAPAGGPIADPSASKEIRHAQAVIEGQNSKIRRSLAEFSRIIELDRRAVREARDAALEEGRLPAAVEGALAATAAANPLSMAGAPEAANEAGSWAKRIRDSLVARYIDALDSAWADHLALAEDVKEGIGLVGYAGKDPGLEYLRILGDAFEEAMAGLERRLIAEVEAAASGAITGGLVAGDGAPRPAPLGPSSTWTYTVEVDALPGFKLGSVSAAMAAAILGPLALPALLVARFSKRWRHGRGGTGI